MLDPCNLGLEYVSGISRAVIRLSTLKDAVVSMACKEAVTSDITCWESFVILHSLNSEEGSLFGLHSNIFVDLSVCFSGVGC